MKKQQMIIVGLLCAFLGFSLVFSASMLWVRGIVNDALGTYGVQVGKTFNSTMYQDMIGTWWEGYQEVLFVAWWGTIFISAISSAMTALIVALVMQVHGRSKETTVR